MRIPDHFRSHLEAHFSYLAGKMADSPDGENAQRMRFFATAPELDKEQLDEVLGRCAGTVALHRHVIDERNRNTRMHGLSVGLALMAGDTEAAKEFRQRGGDQELPQFLRSALYLAALLPVVVEKNYPPFPASPELE